MYMYIIMLCYFSSLSLTPPPPSTTTISPSLPLLLPHLFPFTVSLDPSPCFSHSPDSLYPSLSLSLALCASVRPSVSLLSIPLYTSLPLCSISPSHSLHYPLSLFVCMYNSWCCQWSVQVVLTQHIVVKVLLLSY